MPTVLEKFITSQCIPLSSNTYHISLWCLFGDKEILYEVINFWEQFASCISRTLLAMHCPSRPWSMSVTTAGSRGFPRTHGCQHASFYTTLHYTTLYYTKPCVSSLTDSFPESPPCHLLNVSYSPSLSWKPGNKETRKQMVWYQHFRG